MDQYSVKTISPRLVSDIASALKSVGTFGSVEIFVQRGYVNQITYRKITKTLKSTKHMCVPAR
jgi:hypothetical protein